jgi:hypothetical protein
LLDFEGTKWNEMLLRPDAVVFRVTSAFETGLISPESSAARSRFATALAFLREILPVR